MTDRRRYATVGGEDSVATLVGRAVDDTKGLVHAEIELVKARVGERVSAYRSAAIFFAAAGFLAYATLIALFVGLIMTLATLIGPGLATLAVVVPLLVICAVLGILGKRKLASPLESPPRG